MANPLSLQVSGLPTASAEEAAATASPARGQEMLNFLQTRLNRKDRAPPLVHSWDFWHDRQNRLPKASATDPAAATNAYEARLEPLASISDVKQFWSVFNNFSIGELDLRDSVHLFHRGIKPIWEDPRNARGGSWTFRVAKSQGEEFWQEICLMAIGEKLQEAVEDASKVTFVDDICGVSVGVRYNSYLVQVWNRDAGNEKGVQEVYRVVVEALEEHLRPRDGSAYYKKHAEHAGFAADVNAAAAASSQAADVGRNQTQPPRMSGLGQEMQSLDAVLQGP